TSRQTKNLNKLLIRILLHLQVEFSILILTMKSISILRLTAILLCSMHLLGSASLQAQMNKWVNYSPDLTTVLKNPAMGWMMYEEG
ncbi:hypothetical protein AAH151_21595, partial [Phocaeicola vulgatus]